MLIGRDAEINLLNTYYLRPDNQVMIMYGLEGVGKTALAREFTKDMDQNLYFECKPLYEREQLYHWSNYVHKELGLKEYPDFEELFAAIDSGQSDGTKRVLIFDEFQYLLKYSIEFTMNLFKFLSQSENTYFVILISSSIEWVENSMVKKIGMDAKNITGFFKVKELGFSAFRDHFSKMRFDECVSGYAILGGIPKLWTYFDKNKGLKENIINNILDTNSPLLTYGEEAVKKELRETGVYNTILCTLASGKNKLNDLYNHTLFSRAKISVYIKNLMELGFVTKEFSVDTEGRNNTQKGIYDICINYVDFTYKYLFPFKDELEYDSKAAFYDKHIKPNLKKYTAKFFPIVCREYLEVQNAHGNLPIRYSKLGRWIGKLGTIDFIAGDENGNTLLVLCNWEKPMIRFDDYEWLLFCAKQARIRADYCMLISAQGFDEKLKFASSSKKNIRLVTLDNM
ncbi:MAG: AAA family ATPase [Lachnospiraceae bacterium]|nr:AAA family ATPase [Lachnospiraceae bacterium]